MNPGDALLRSSVRVSVLLMLTAWMLMLRPRRTTAVKTLARGAWTAGYLAFLIHLWAAFESVHHWSHEAAVRDTARQTRELVGLDWGGGVWVNYLFALAWSADVVWWTLFPQSRARRPRAVGAALHGFLGFVAFNATVVFATGFARALGAAGCLVLLVEAWRWGGRGNDAPV